jgi:hypothetical protein
MDRGVANGGEYGRLPAHPDQSLFLSAWYSDRHVCYLSRGSLYSMDSLQPAPGAPQAMRLGTRIALITLGVVALFTCCVCPGVALIYSNMSQSSAQATSTANRAQQLSYAATFAAAATYDTKAATVQATLAVIPPGPTAAPPVQAATATPKPAVPTATPKPHASTPTATPKPHASTPTATPNSQPTATPCPGVNCNPWGYNFSPPGNLIYNPPSAFCNYFNCIANFSTGTGYVVECQDLTFSKTGGVPGSCSQDGGNLRPLYSH